ncbi:MAG TPA: hypothetical protein VGG76_03585 [Gemmatimonadaceae bacterium]
MNSSAVRRAGFVVSSVLTFAPAACRSHLTGPARSTVHSVIGRPAADRIHRSVAGVVFTIDHEHSTLAADGGRAVRLPRDLTNELEKDFDLMTVVEERRAHFRLQPRYAALGRALAAGSARVLRASEGSAVVVGATSSSNSTFGSVLLPRASADPFDGLDENAISCPEIAQAIYTEQPIYDRALDELDHALLALARSGPGTAASRPDDEDAAEVAEWRYDVELNKMNFLAVLQSSYDCWGGDWFDPSVSSGAAGDTPDGTGCHRESGTLSVKAGTDWRGLWSGSYSVCGRRERPKL